MPTDERDIEGTVFEDEVTHSGDEDHTQIRRMNELDDEYTDGPCLIRKDKRIPLPLSPFIIGRDPGSDLLLQYDYIARQNAEIIHEDGQYILADLEGEGGILINNVPIQEPTPLQHGDRITINTIGMIFSEDGEIPPLPEPLPRDYDNEEMEDDIDRAAESMTPQSLDLNQGLDVEASSDEAHAPALPSGAEQPEAELLTPELRLVLKGAAGFFILLMLILIVKMITGGPAGKAPNDHPIDLPPVDQVFHRMEISASPLQAEILADGINLGKTPLAKNIELRNRSSIKIEAVFTLQELGILLTREIDVRPDLDSGINTLDIEGNIGTIVFRKIPGDVEVYLSYLEDGKSEKVIKHFERNALPARAPVPFGDYTLELRRSDAILYKRSFKIHGGSNESWTHTISIQEAALSLFPAQLRSKPEEVAVFGKGTKGSTFIGNTPLDLDFPLGSHELTFKLEGYYDQVRVLENHMNYPVILEVNLETSPAGSKILEAVEAIEHRSYSQARDLLYTALKSSPTKREIGKAHYFLGETQSKLGQVQLAINHYNKAKKHPDFKVDALLGLAEINAKHERVDQALSQLNLIFQITRKSSHLKRADHILGMVSPVFAILFVNSSPQGALVLVDGKVIEKKTPVLISNLSVGDHEIRIQKPGFAIHNDEVKLEMGQRKSIIVKLKPFN